MRKRQRDQGRGERRKKGECDSASRLYRHRSFPFSLVFLAAFPFSRFGNYRAQLGSETFPSPLMTGTVRPLCVSSSSSDDPLL